jgi:hypothetical protein
MSNSVGLFQPFQQIIEQQRLLLEVNYRQRRCFKTENQTNKYLPSPTIFGLLNAEMKMLKDGFSAIPKFKR